MSDPIDKSGKKENPYEASASDATAAAELPPTVSVPLAVILLLLIILLFFADVGLGVAAVIVAVPAYVRAATRSWRRVAAGQSLSVGDRILHFFGSLAVVAICAIAGGIAFFATCLTGLLYSEATSSDHMVLTLGLSCLCFLGAAGVLYWACWPRRRRI